MRSVFLAGMAVCALTAGAVQDVTVTGLTLSGGEVTVSYSLASAGDAIITFDILTNGVSIGAANLTGGDTGTKPGITGDVNCRVTGPFDGTIKWRPYRTWKGVPAGSLKNVKAVVKAWSPFAPPDYMVVDLTKTGAEAVRYYESEAALPGGGVKALDDYRTTKLVMRHITAPVGGTFMKVKSRYVTVDSVYRNAADNVATKLLGRVVTNRCVAELADDYWMAVFELTQKQYETVMGTWPKCFFTNAACRAMRPVENLFPNEFRGPGWPEEPSADKFLGKLRSRVPLAFDQPTETQWEYAACAGRNPGHYPDGTLFESDLTDTYEGCLAARLNSNVMRFARMMGTTKYGREQVTWSGTSNPNIAAFRDHVADGSWDAEDGTAVVGSYAPNDWGLYDVLGNVAELCLDWVDFRYTDDSKKGLGTAVIRGAVNIDPDDWRYSLMQKMGIEDNPNTAPYRVARGGAWFHLADHCHLANRDHWIYDQRHFASPELMPAVRGVGYRLCCPAK